MSAGSLPSGLTRGYAKSFKDMLVEMVAKPLTIRELRDLDDAEAIEAAVNAHGRAHNPKWDHPVMGYAAFSEDQRAYLREQARIRLDHAVLR